jgi:thiamine phosphate synthase YjbQ (UPF0047 family)
MKTIYQGPFPMIYQREIQFSTKQHREMRDLTAEVARIVADSKIRDVLVPLQGN